MTIASLFRRFAVGRFAVGRFASLLLLVTPCAATAQWIRGADTLSASAVADSQVALRTLRTASERNPNDAAVRYRIGWIAWVLAVRSEYKPSIRGLNGPMLKGLADSSLRLAVQLDQKNAKYELALGRFLRASSDPFLRIMAPAHVDRALEESKAPEDSIEHRAALLERARLAWLIYDTDVDKAECVPPPSIDAAAAVQPLPAMEGMIVPTEVALKMLHNAVINCASATDRLGEMEYLRAEALLREVHDALPGDRQAYRYLAMLLADKNRWPDLAALARDRVRRMPDDAWAWLDLALAVYRRGSAGTSLAIFDSALTKLEPRERGRLFAFHRVLSDLDSAKYVARPEVERQRWEASFWSGADPLWSRPTNDPRTEFLARVVYAELRWTVEEMGVRGADSDRGTMHIRYGPPDRRFSYRAINGPCRGIGSQFTTRMNSERPMQSLLPMCSDVVTFWDYDNGLTLVFWGAPTYGTARFPIPDMQHVERAIEIRPAAFDNVAREKILPIAHTLTRFRAGDDSVDVLAITQSPVAEIRGDVPNGLVFAHTWLVSRAAGPDGFEMRDSVQVPLSGLDRRIYRVAPAEYVYRVETTAAGTMVAGRATTAINTGRDTVTGFSSNGFGISDLLLTTATRAAKPVPVRWRDFDIAPVFGAVTAGSTIDVIWENYELGARANLSQYNVTITIERQRGTSGRILASILGLAAGAVGIDRKDDRVTFKFDRSGPAAPKAFVDRVTLALGETPRGEYLMTVEIEDKVSGRRTKRTVPLTVER